MSTESLLAVQTNALAVLTGSHGAAYHTTKAQTDALDQAGGALALAANNQRAAEISAKSLTAVKVTKKRDLASNLTALQSTFQADETISDEMLLALGFSPRRNGGKPQPKIPVPVTGLSADPQANGTVKLKWERRGNSALMMFVVETSADGAAWTMIKSTTRCTFTGEGFAPGVAAWFRVTATTSTTASTPSLPVGIYAPSATRSVQLRVA